MCLLIYRPNTILTSGVYIILANVDDEQLSSSTCETGRLKTTNVTGDRCNTTQTTYA